MDRDRFSRIGHGDLPWWNPIDGADFDRLIARSALPAGARVLDVGCGNGNLLRRALAAIPGAMGIGVDRKLPVPGPDLREEPFDAARFAPASFDLVLCLGASHAVGTAAEALRAFRPLLKPGGCVLLGEGFWEREPDPAYLALLDATRDDLRDLAGTAALGPEAGYATVEVAATPRDAWDRYEGTYAGNIERFAADHPADPDAPAMLARIRPWREGYLRWGRTTLGFALLLLRRTPGTPEPPGASEKA